MNAREVPNEFQVAFSFAGEQRDLVRNIAKAVERELGEPSVFFDEWYQHYLAGQDADLKLQKIYGKRCVLVVVCISENYGDKPWTRAEHRAIRARMMSACSSANETDDLGMLPLRVGEGEIDDINFNTIAPDIRTMSVAEAAELIIARLRLILPGPDNGNASDVQWPEESPSLNWPVADHRDVRGEFKQLLTSTTTSRFLPLQGRSESGKSHITRQMLGNALRIPDLACGRFDFKGTTDLDDELRSFVRNLGVDLPPSGLKLNDRFSHILDSLSRRSQPVLMIFDTYEAAGEANYWMETQLLPNLIRASWLRVVVAGQKVPKTVGTMWESYTFPLKTLRPPPPADWYDYGRRHRPELTLEEVETLCRYACDKASLLNQLLGPVT